MAKKITSPAFRLRLIYYILREAFPHLFNQVNFIDLSPLLADSVHTMLAMNNSDHSNNGKNKISGTAVYAAILSYISEFIQIPSLKALWMSCTPLHRNGRKRWNLGTLRAHIPPSRLYHPNSSYQFWAKVLLGPPPRPSPLGSQVLHFIALWSLRRPLARLHVTLHSYFWIMASRWLLLSRKVNDLT